MNGATIKSVWQESHPLTMWRYDYPDREMAWWEMPTHHVLSAVRRLTTRYVVIWHLLTTGPNTRTSQPWEAGGWRRVRAILALLLPLPIRWHYPHYPHNADAVLIWWASDIGSTPSGLSWSAYCIGVGYGKNWRAYIYEDGE